MKKAVSLIALLACATMARSSLAQTPSAPVLSARAAARLLDQATWGPTPAAIAELQQAGIDAWLLEQFAWPSYQVAGHRKGAPLSDLPDQPLLNAAGKLNNNLAPVQAAFFRNAVTGQDQLRQRVAFALSEIWVVSATAGVPNADAYPLYWRIFRDNAFGSYRDLIKAVTLNPAMGHYLDMANNNQGNAARGTTANENYARELMQLFTLGLTQLNPDGTAVLDSSGNPLPTYTQSDVTNLAKALTGWTYPTRPNGKLALNNPAYYIGPMIPVEAEHDTSEKDIFGGVKIPAGQSAEQDLSSVIDALMSQPVMAPFISQQLIQHLVTSNPSPAYTQRVSKVFQTTGGNMQSVITAILTDPEARAGDVESTSIDTNFGHLREPVLFMANLLRALNATLGPSSTISNDAASLGQTLFYAPSVFSYFSPQYRTTAGLLGPEFQIYSTQTAAQRADIVNSALYGTLDKSTKIDLTPYLQYAGDTTNLIATINTWLLHGAMSSDLKQAATSAAAAATTNQKKVQAALYTVLTSGEYQIVH